MAFFTKELQTTRFGKTFLIACNQQQIAIKELRNIRSVYVRIPWTKPARLSEENWQRAYQNATERASQALTVLSKHYGWPLEYAFDETFTWLPSPRARQSRRAP
jgi:hypothetical protein